MIEVDPGDGTKVLNTRAETWMPLLVASMLYSVAVVTGWLSPQIIYGAVARFQISIASAGSLVTIEGATAGVLSMLLGAYPPKIAIRRFAAAGLALYVAANGVSLWIPSFVGMLCARFVAGVAGAILIFCGVMIVSAANRNADRGFAAINAASTIYGAALLIILPILSSDTQGLRYLVLCSVAATIMAPLLWLVPTHIRAPEKVPQREGELLASGRSKQIAKIVVLVMVVPLTVQALTTVIFSIGIGRSLGMLEASISTTMGIAIMLSTVAPFLAVALMRRLRLWPVFFASAVVMFAANLFIVSTTSALVFQIFLVMNLTMAAFQKPLLPAWCLDVDPSGRSSTIMMGSFVGVGAFIPVAVGALVDSSGYAALWPIIVVTGCTFMALLIALRVLESRPREARHG